MEHHKMLKETIDSNIPKSRKHRKESVTAAMWTKKNHQIISMLFLSYHNED